MSLAESAKLRELEKLVRELQEKVAALEAKRGPGRPPKDQAA